jgi:glycosyltransferase involved in cell wall biosynthesis
MIFLIYSETNEINLQKQIGLSEYSYFFVLKEFRKLLEEIGEVIVVYEPESEVDELYFHYSSKGKDCAFLSFSPPHKTVINLKCPTIPVFAWEFNTFPSEVWDDDIKNDWYFVLKKLGCAITLSSFTVSIIQKSIGNDFLSVSIPTPIWDQYQNVDYNWSLTQLIDITLEPNQVIIDTLKITIPPFHNSYSAEPKKNLLFNTVIEKASSLSRKLTLQGIVYTYVLNPLCARKNLRDMLTAFCFAFRKVKDVTLVLKLTSNNYFNGLFESVEILSKMLPFDCRVVLLYGYISEDNYHKLIKATTYTINTSSGEGQCLPLTEFMSSGKPAISPQHTAMKDYIDEENAFIIHSNLEPTHWPHDNRAAFRTLHHKIHFQSLIDSYLNSYKLAMTNPGKYSEMGAQAKERLRNFCQKDILLKRLRDFFFQMNLIKKEFNVKDCRKTPPG